MCFYSPMQHEIQLLGMMHKALHDEKKCFVPVVESKTDIDFFQVYSWDDYKYSFEKKGKYKIWEPKQLSTRHRLIDTLDHDSRLLVVMPGLAFDLEGRRLGYGGGYYDRYLKKVMEVLPREQIVLIAPALEAQIVGKVPTSDDDVKIDALVTKQGLQYMDPSKTLLTDNLDQSTFSSPVSPRENARRSELRHLITHDFEHIPMSEILDRSQGLAKEQV